METILFTTGIIFLIVLIISIHLEFFFLPERLKDKFRRWFKKIERAVDEKIDRDIENRRRNGDFNYHPSMEPAMQQTPVEIRPHRIIFEQDDNESDDFEVVLRSMTRDGYSYHHLTQFTQEMEETILFSPVLYNPITTTIPLHEIKKTTEQIIEENLQIIRNSPHTYISWGLSCPVVLIQKEKEKTIPQEYQAWCVVELPMVHLKTWFVNTPGEYSDMMNLITKWNYELDKPCAKLRSVARSCSPSKPIKRRLDI